MRLSFETVDFRAKRVFPGAGDHILQVDLVAHRNVFARIAMKRSCLFAIGAASVFSVAAAQQVCDLAGNWTYLSPNSFDHVSVPAWNNQDCIYEFKGASMFEHVECLLCQVGVR